MGKKSKGGGQTQTTVQKADPWPGVQPNLLELYGHAGDWFRKPGAVAGGNWNLNHSMNMTRDRALAGNPLTSTAQGTAQWFASGRGTTDNPVLSGRMSRENMWARGDMMGANPMLHRTLSENPIFQAAGNPAAMANNPYIDDMVGAATRDVREEFMESIAPALASQFSAAGRTGSGAHTAAFGTAAGKLAGRLGDINANIRSSAMENALQRQFQAYEADIGRRGAAFEADTARRFGAYESDLQRRFGAAEAEAQAMRQGWLAQPQIQLQAAALAPQLAQLSYLDADRLREIGLLERDITQQQIDEPLKRLQAYSALLQGASGYGTTTSSGNQSSTQPYNRLMGAVGGGLMGNALGGALGMTGPWGAILGAGLGLFG